MRRRVRDPRVVVLRRFAAAGLALLIGSAGAFRPEREPHPPDQQGKAPAGNQADPTKDNQRKTDEFVEAAAGHQRPGRKPGMRLARPARRPPDVARRPRHRLPPPRPLRPVRLPRRPCPGHLPLPDPFWGPDRRQGAEEPGRQGSRLLDQSGRPAADGCGGKPAAPATAGNAAPAPAASPSPAPSAAPAPPAK